MTGILRWARIRDLRATVEVYVDDSSSIFPDITVVRTATGVYEVTGPGVQGDRGWPGIWVSPQQGQTMVFRACKTFQTVSAGDPADTVVVRVRATTRPAPSLTPTSTSSCCSSRHRPIVGVS